MSNVGRVTLVTLYPVLAAGEKPHGKFAVLLTARAKQSVLVQATVQCSKGGADTTRRYNPLRVQVDKRARRFPLAVPVFRPDYCSVQLTVTGRGWLKASLLGL